MRYSLLVVAFLFACGGKRTTHEPPATGDQSPDDRDAGGDQPDAGHHGGVDGGTDGGVDGGLGGYTATLTQTRLSDAGTQEEEPGDAFICCISPANRDCQIARGEANFSPARQVTVLAGGYALITAKIYSDANCRNLDRILSDALYFPDPPDLWAVQVDFSPALPVGMQLSMKWQTGGCDETQCVSYTVGTSPALCGP